MPQPARRIINAATLAVLLAVSPPSKALMAQVAPLPDGIIASGQPKVRGVYAVSRFGGADVNEQVARLESACADRGVAANIEGRHLPWAGKRQIYRTRDMVVVFEDIPTIRLDALSCTARISLLRKIKVMRASKNNLREAGWADDLPVCPKSPYYRCTDQIVAEVTAKCVRMGDSFMGSTICYSAQSDLSRGLVLASSDYSDGGSESSWEFDIVMTNALIDSAVFNPKQL